MNGAGAWSEGDALQAWLDELEADEAAAELARKRLAEDGGDARERAYRAAAGRWLQRGQGRVALALLDRSASPPVRPSTQRERLDLAAALAAMPGEAGLPALTPSEREALLAAQSPQEALDAVRAAQRRLRSHGAEARTLLRRWLDRQQR